jgi:hypothetical protein
VTAQKESAALRQPLREKAPPDWRGFSFNYSDLAFLLLTALLSTLAALLAALVRILLVLLAALLVFLAALLRLVFIVGIVRHGRFLLGVTSPEEATPAFLLRSRNFHGFCIGHRKRCWKSELCDLSPGSASS